MLMIVKNNFQNVRTLTRFAEVSKGIKVVSLLSFQEKNLNTKSMDRGKFDCITFAAIFVFGFLGFRFPLKLNVRVVII